MRGPRRLALAVVAVCASIGVVAPAASGQTVPKLDFQPCGGEAATVVCTTAKVPLDYDRPDGRKISLFLAKSPATDQAHKLGTLFYNFGGPGGTAANALEFLGTDLFPAFNTRYDIIGMDPRGVGQSEPSIDCKANQETQGIYSQPFPTPDNVKPPQLIAKDLRYIARCGALNQTILPHVSTANVARDIDLLRQSLGEDKVAYFGYSYGTFLGATYASLFPRNYSRMVLDGPVDATDYINDPLATLSSQSGGFERALGRFFQACARDQVNCLNFGADDPWDAFDQLVDRANETPLPAGGSDPRPVDGDDILFGVIGQVYAKQNWPDIAKALAAATAAQPDATMLRDFADQFYGRNPDGSYSPGNDRYFTIGAAEQQYPRNTDLYSSAGKRSWTEHEHTWWNNGYVELNYGLWPYRDRDAYLGPFHIPNSAVTPLVVATTYDPATPYRGAKNLVRDLGNARLLTMRGDGHTAYAGNSPDCIDPAVEAYINDGTLPAPGTSCKQDVPFVQQQQTAQALKVPTLVNLQHPRAKPLVAFG